VSLDPEHEPREQRRGLLPAFQPRSQFEAHGLPLRRILSTKAASTPRPEAVRPGAERESARTPTAPLLRTRTSGPQPRSRRCPFAVIAITSESRTSLSYLVQLGHRRVGRRRLAARPPLPPTRASTRRRSSSNARIRGIDARECPKAESRAPRVTDGLPAKHGLRSNTESTCGGSYWRSRRASRCHALVMLRPSADTAVPCGENSQTESRLTNDGHLVHRLADR
jgi:hypothetical protein